MRLILRDYKNSNVIAECNLIDDDIYKLSNCPASFRRECEEALYFANNADATQGTIADDWSDDYNTPINPYMAWEIL
jgi:hypothetical protein